MIPVKSRFSSLFGQEFRDHAGKARLYSGAMELKDWLAAAKKHSGYTLEKLAGVVGRSKANVGHWVQGKHLPSYSQLVAISLATKFPLPKEGFTEFREDGVSLPPAQLMSHFTTSLPVQLQWEKIVDASNSLEIPADFVVELPDDALGQKLPKGTSVWFRRVAADYVPTPKTVCLIEVSARRYVRQIAMDGAGDLVARALDDAYPSFQRFEILAAMFMVQSSTI